MVDMMNNFFSLENMCVKPPINHLPSIEKSRAVEWMEIRIIIQKCHKYEIGLLWKHEDVKLPDSREMTFKSILCLQTRTKYDKLLTMRARHKINRYIEKGLRKKLSSNEMLEVHPRTRHLPTFPVVNPNKSGKIGMIFDAAAKVNKVSVNSALLKEPDQVTYLLGVLMIF